MSVLDYAAPADTDYTPQANDLRADRRKTLARLNRNRFLGETVYYLDIPVARSTAYALERERADHVTAGLWLLKKSKIPAFDIVPLSLEQARARLAERLPAPPPRPPAPPFELVPPGEVPRCIDVTPQRDPTTVLRDYAKALEADKAAKLATEAE
jgi:hypothetical protein